MPNVNFQKKIKYFFDLIRLNKPIGFMLLMWPCWLAMTLVPQEGLELINWYFYFFLGAFLMRSSGCIINDLIDINLDSKVARTADRALTSNKITVFESLILLFFLLLLSLVILLQFRLEAILIGLASIPLIIIYPFLKRYTHWPQLGLGIVFSWGVLIVSFQFSEVFTYDYLILYLACIVWTLAYDTIYAYQDIKDDINLKIKSTAVLFGSKGHKYVLAFYNLFFVMLGFLGFYTSNSFISLVVIIALIIVINVYLNKWKPDSKDSCNYYFRFNNFIGMICFLFLIIF